MPWTNDSLLMGIDYRLYIWTGTQWRSRTMPFNLSRWGRGMHDYEGELYGGGQSCEIYRWLQDSQWEYVTTLPVILDEQNVGSMETMFGRVFLSTWGTSGNVGHLLVTAAEPLGTLVSEVHDFGTRTTGGLLSWDDFRPGEGNLAAFQVRSAVTLAELPDRPFLGPDGTGDTYFETPGTPLSGHHQGRRYFQYRAELRCPEGVRMPMLRSVTLEVDSLETGSVEDLPPHEPGSSNGPRLTFAAPQPNPARTSVWFAAGIAPGADFGTEIGVGGGALHLEVRDPQGRRVRSVAIPLDGAQDARWRWDLRDGRGRHVPAGLYHVTASLSGPGTPSQTRSVVIVP
ncbi:MAG: hypothetical protein GF330_15020 [Candidatus Eisenbacteria bacterium]|nr:hypothetical protein [Candidatus Eisenbacteria bacterium]